MDRRKAQVFPVVFASALFLGSCSNTESPSEPRAASLAVVLAEDPAPAPGGGALFVTNEACACAVVDSLEVTVTGGPSHTYGVGSALGCNWGGYFPQNVSGSRFVLTARGHTALGQPVVAAPLEVVMPGDYSGPVSLSIRLSCVSR